MSINFSSQSLVANKMQSRCTHIVVAGSMYCALHRNEYEEELENTALRPILDMDDENVMEKIKELEKTVSDLTSMVSSLKLTSTRKRRSSALTKAKILFYHDYKMNAHVISELHNRNMPFTLRMTRLPDGTTKECRVYNWLKVKQITDDVFKNVIPDSERLEYISKAQHILQEKTID